MARYEDSDDYRLGVAFRNGYFPVRVLTTGAVAGVARMAFTFGLFVGCDRPTYERRYCYAARIDAERALREWSGEGDPPGLWIKEKPGDRLGPGAIEEGESNGNVSG